MEVCAPSMAAVVFNPEAYFFGSRAFRVCLGYAGLAVEWMLGNCPRRVSRNFWVWPGLDGGRGGGEWNKDAACVSAVGAAASLTPHLLHCSTHASPGKPR